MPVRGKSIAAAGKASSSFRRDGAKVDMMYGTARTAEWSLG